MSRYFEIYGNKKCPKCGSAIFERDLTREEINNGDNMFAEYCIGYLCDFDQVVDILMVGGGLAGFARSMENHAEKQWATLEELGFDIVKNIEGYEFKGWLNIYGQHITVFVDKIREDDNVWGVHYYYHEGATIPQELHKAVELKMIELGLWEE